MIPQKNQFGEFPAERLKFRILNRIAYTENMETKISIRLKRVFKKQSTHAGNFVLHFIFKVKFATCYDISVLIYYFKSFPHFH